MLVLLKKLQLPVPACTHSVIIIINNCNKSVLKLHWILISTVKSTDIKYTNFHCWYIPNLDCYSILCITVHTSVNRGMGLKISATVSGNRMIETNQTNTSETKQIIGVTYTFFLISFNQFMYDWLNVYTCNNCNVV